MHSHSSRVQDGEISYFKDITRQECLTMKTSGIFLIAGMHIAGLKPNNTVHKTVTFAGEIERQGECEGTTYSDLYGKLENALVAGWQKKKRHILLLVDNCPAHSHVKDLTNIRLMFFPPNVTSVLQPMDQGVIQSFKCHYRKKMVMKFLEDSESADVKKISLLQAMRFIAEAWDSVTSETIRNCYKKAGLVTGEDDDVEEDFSPRSWMIANGVEVTISNIDDYVRIDDQLVVSEAPTDTEILRSIVQNEEDNSDDEDQQEEPASQIVCSAEALSALATLCAFYETNDGIDEEFGHHYHRMKNIIDKFALKNKKAKQPSILSFFNRVWH